MPGNYPEESIQQTPGTYQTVVNCLPIEMASHPEDFDPLLFNLSPHPNLSEERNA
jgi:hypothetical protein